jgi:hypothetical protein
LVKISGSRAASRHTDDLVGKILPYVDVPVTLTWFNARQTQTLGPPQKNISHDSHVLGELAGDRTSLPANDVG